MTLLEEHISSCTFLDSNSAPKINQHMYVLDTLTQELQSLNVKQNRQLMTLLIE